MASGGGGSWKVAYADFVTAMMAFFLVMWICGQDQELRRAVSYYFTDPFGNVKSGSTRKPNDMGSLFNALKGGEIPESESAMMGRGRQSHTFNGQPNRPTKLIHQWLHVDKQAHEYWREQAKLHHEQATRSEDVLNKKTPLDTAAAYTLANQLRDEMTGDVFEHPEGIQQELLIHILQDVNWIQLAEDLLLVKSQESQ